MRAMPSACYVGSWGECSALGTSLNNNNNSMKGLTTKWYQYVPVLVFRVFRSLMRGLYPISVLPTMVKDDWVSYPLQYRFGC